MANKVAYRYREFLFALVRPANTALIVSGIIIYLHSAPHTRFMLKQLTPHLLPHGLSYLSPF
jgi:hypothetical protein